jgi:DNA-binding NarL/FixJ family response regulator
MTITNGQDHRVVPHTTLPRVMLVGVPGVVRRMLEESGFVTSEVVDQDEAMHAAAELHPDVVLMDVTSRVLHPRSNGNGSSPLTKREQEILQLVADGYSTVDLAGALFISTKTVKNHLASIYAKLGARDRTQAVITGVRIGIIHLRHD